MLALWGWGVRLSVEEEEEEEEDDDFYNSPCSIQALTVEKEVFLLY